MKELEMEAVVEDCHAQLYYEAMYATGDAVRSFHSKVNGDPNASVSHWASDGTREVRFVMPTNVPAMLKKSVGLDSVAVLEVQKLEWLGGDTSSFKVSSEPQLNFPGANKFTTKGHLVVSSLPNGTCQVKVLMQCSAAMPWPVQASVEGMMGTEAIASIGTFLDFCKDYYAKWRAEQQLQPERPAGPQAAAARAASIVEVDQFYDAVDDESAAAAALAQEEASLVPYTPPRLEDIIVDCLRQIQVSTSETAQVLKKLEDLLRNMDDNMQVLREKLVGKRPAPPVSHPSGQTGGTACRAATLSTSSHASIYLGLLAAASLVCGAGAVAYMRYRLVVGGGGSGGGGGAAK